MLNNEEYIFENYESPIKIKAEDATKAIIKEVNDIMEDKIVYSVSQILGVDVDRKELARALFYDRDQYAKGYADGYEKGRAVAIDAILSVINTIKGTEENENDSGT